MAGAEQPQDEQREEQGVSLTGIAYDKDLYDGGADRFAGYTQSIGVGEDDEQDERDQALARCTAPRSIDQQCSCGRGACICSCMRADLATASRNSSCRCWRRRMQYNAPKKIMAEVPVEGDAAEQVRLSCCRMECHSQARPLFSPAMQPG